MTNHIWDGYWFIANGRAWASLPPDLQKIVSDAINDAGLKQREDIQALNATVQKDLLSKGLAFSNPRAGQLPGQAARVRFLQRVERALRRRSLGLLESVVGKLA